MAPLRVVKKGETANLLALDGGGIKGISTLVIIEKIMLRIQAIDNLPTTPFPCDYFDLAGGTSTGGIVALMLFRLRMSAKDAIQAYNDIGKSVFPKTSWASRLYKGTLFDDAPLLAAIDTVVEKYGPTADDKKKKGSSLLVDGQSRMFMCTTLKERGEAVLMRSYMPPKDALPYSRTDENLDDDSIAKISIKDAVRATSAAPMYFPELALKAAKGKSVVFWDGGVLNNNPIDQLWRTRLDLVADADPAPHISCILSVGTSFCAEPKPELGFITGMKAYAKAEPGDNMAMKLSRGAVGTALPFLLPILDPWSRPVGKAVEFLTNTDAKHVDFGRYIDRIKNRADEPDKATRYFRFNCPTLDKEIDMSSAEEMPWLSKRTEEWLTTDEVHIKKLEEVAQLLVKTKPKQTT